MGLEISKNILSTQTLIFLDFETTGLANDGNNDPLFNPTKTNETPGERMRRLETILRLGFLKHAIYIKFFILR